MHDADPRRKSAIYQLAGVLLDGPAIVVSPLIALQRDQVDGVDAAEAGMLNSKLSASDREATLAEAEEGELESLLLAPEQLAKEELGYFGEEYEPPCDNCDHGDAVAAEDAQSPFTTGARVAHDEWGERTVGAVENGQITVVFDSVGHKTLAAELVAVRGLLTGIGD